MFAISMLFVATVMDLILVNVKEDTLEMERSIALVLLS